MRIWSIHPKYLDAKGLVALWRETLLAKQILEGNTKGYKSHPQLNRFKRCGNPLDAINSYLAIVYEEATSRKYNFDKKKLNGNPGRTSLPVTKGQIKYEMTHLLNKLKIRDVNKYQALINEHLFDPHPLFNLIEGPIEDWEIIIQGK